jgi:hypothetical protein
MGHLNIMYSMNYGLGLGQRIYMENTILKSTLNNVQTM